MKRFLSVFMLLLGFVSSSVVTHAQSPGITIGSKSFTESVILGEILAGLAMNAGAPVEHRKQLGGTRILWNALLRGEIDAYPEYTGTIAREIFATEKIASQNSMINALAAKGISMSAPLGFNNTYALAVTTNTAKRLSLKSISDLKRFRDLKLGFSNEFMDRADGWPALKKRYGLPQSDARGLDHDLAYRGLKSGDIDVIDVYTTDAEIPYYGLTPSYFTDRPSIRSHLQSVPRSRGLAVRSTSNKWQRSMLPSKSNSSLKAPLLRISCKAPSRYLSLQNKMVSENGFIAEPWNICFSWGFRYFQPF